MFVSHFDPYFLLRPLNFIAAQFCFILPVCICTQQMFTITILKFFNFSILGEDFVCGGTEMKGKTDEKAAEILILKQINNNIIGFYLRWLDLWIIRKFIYLTR